MKILLQKTVILVATSVLFACGGEIDEDGDVNGVVSGNRVPVAKLAYQIEGNTVHLDASESSDPDGDTLRFVWHLGDGEVQHGASHSVTYNSMGRKTVLLVVADAQFEISTTQLFEVDGGMSVRPIAASPSQPGGGDAQYLRGKLLYESLSMSCLACHGADGQLPTFKAIDPTRAFYQHSSTGDAQYTLEEYLAQWMPVGREDSCVGECAADIAYYIRSWNAAPDPSPQPEPGVTPTPGPSPTVTPTPSAAPTPGGSVANGKRLYESSALACVTCHGIDGQSPAPAVFPSIDPGKTAFNHADTPGVNYSLAAYLTVWMPPANPDACDTSCGLDIAAYIRSWSLTASPAPSASPMPSVIPEPSVIPLPSVVPGPSPLPSPQPSPIVSPVPTVVPSPTPIGNQPPSVMFTTPSDGASIAAGSTLYVRVTATDSDGSVANVRLSMNGQFIRQENLDPYEWGGNNAADTALVNLAAGAYTLSAVATDNQGATRNTSIRVTVGQATPSPTVAPSPSPVVVPTPTPVPTPALSLAEGYALYDSKGCVICHGNIASSTKRGALPVSIDYALANEAEMRGLRVNAAEVDAISRALNDDAGICRDAADPGPVVMRRLSNDEYRNTLRDLLGVTPALTDLPADSIAGNFTNVGSANVNSEHALAYAALLPQLVSESFTNGGSQALRRFTTCDIAAGGENCARTILQNFLPRAFRRDLATDELDRYLQHYRAAKTAQQSNLVALQLAMEAALLSPHFNFIVEIDANPASTSAHALNSFELASRLSYFLWASMPDDALFAAARDNSLMQASVLEAQVDRMLDDSKANALVDVFFTQWMALTQFAKAENPEFAFINTELRAAMVQETKLFFRNFFLRESRDLREMLSENRTHMNQSLAAHYGVAGISGSTFQQLASPVDRSGLLSHASILAATSKEDDSKLVSRGKWVLDQLLCESPRNPPPNVGELPPDNGSDLTLKERLAEHRRDPACAACHASMDPIGFGLENFDQFGLWRDMYANGDPVDATGELPDGQLFEGVQELSAILAGDERLQQCMTEKFMNYARGALVSARDNCKVKALAQSAMSEGFSVRSLIKTLVTDDSFLRRRTADEE